MSASVLATPPDDVNGIAELWTMAAIVFLVFYSNYMVAPLIPALARAFGVHSHDLRWLIPGSSMMYGAATLPYGILSDRFGRYPVLRILLGFAAVTTMSLSFAWAMGPDRDRLKIQSYGNLRASWKDATPRSATRAAENIKICPLSRGRVR